MLRKIKCLSLFLVLVFMFQSVLMPSISAAEIENVVMEISMPQLSLTNFGNTSNSVELVWTSSDNNIKAASYDIYRNDSLIKTTKSFTYTDTELTPETKYTYMVKAKDSDGKVIAESNSINVTTTLQDILSEKAAANLTGSALGLDQTTTDMTGSAIALDQAEKEELENIEESKLFNKGNPEFETDKFIIKYKNEISKAKARKAFEKIDKINKNKKNDLKDYKNKDMDIISLNKKEKFKDLVTDLIKNDVANDIEYIQPDYQLNLSSNDTYYSSQWGLENKIEVTENSNNADNPSILDRLEMLPPNLRTTIEANLEFKEFIMNTPVQELNDKLMKGDVPGNVEPQKLIELASDPAFMNTRDSVESQTTYLCDAGVADAWEKSTGIGVTVAVIDTGVDTAHEDLVENIWANWGEIADNGIDDDGNGKIDDTNGWNFSDNNNVVCDTSNMENENHGTHVAGIIAAVKDNEKGIAGVAPCAKVMPLKVFKNGTAYTSDIINAIEYAESMGAKIVNCSWGSTAENTALKETIQNSNMLFVCAAGNSSANIDSNPIYPAAFDCSNIITVASVNQNGSLSGFSNYGENSVDVAAPGEGIQSTLTGNAYGENNGTSMAAGFVSGEAALLISNSANMSAIELKDRIVRCSDHLSSLIGKVYKGCKINCINAIRGITIENITEVSSDTINQSSNSQENPNELSLFSTLVVEDQFIKVAAGNSHSVAIKKDGTVWTCGNNYYGQLGDGTTIDRNIPVQVIGLSGILAISVGSNHNLALKNDGTVWAWGDNSCGQLGDGSKENKNIPIQVKCSSGIVAIAGGGSHNLVLRYDGTVYSWGDNSRGQLGDGTLTSRYTPVQINGLSNIKAISAGGSHSLALTNDGRVWGWGNNYFGQAGVGPSTQYSYPGQIQSLVGVTAIACGGSHSIVLQDTNVWTWGCNYSGQLGDGTRINRMSPTKIDALSGTVIIASGGSHNLAFKWEGTLWAWGDNSNGELGDGTTVNRSVPIQVNNMSATISLAVGGNHSLAVKKNGTILAWGDNYCGQLGDGESNIRTTIPVKSIGINGITTISSGLNHNLALKSDNTVWAWGQNVYGQLGDGTTNDRAIPIQILSGSCVTASDGNHSSARKNDDSFWAWGHNADGQLGDGTTTDKASPVKIGEQARCNDITSGDYHSLFLLFTGTVSACGQNSYGQLGDGTTSNRESYVQVSGLSGVIAVSGGGYHSLALKNDGTVWTWGRNYEGQLGNGTTTNKTTAVQVSGLSGVIAVSGGGYHSLALKNDGTVWTWGQNYYGQLGNGTTTNSTTAVQVSGLSGVVAIAGGKNHSLALKNDGTVWAWGYNRDGQLGDGTTTDRTTAVQVSGLSGISAITGGAYHSLALKNDGTVWAWGYNYNGQLGNGKKGYSEYPKYLFATLGYTTTCTTTCTAGNTFNLILKLKNMKRITGRTFTITYNTSDITSVTDLCGMSYNKELVTGLIAETGITIVQNDPGIIKFTIDKAIPDVKAWSGIVNIIELKPSVSGQVTLTCKVE